MQGAIVVVIYEEPMQSKISACYGCIVYALIALVHETNELDFEQF